MPWKILFHEDFDREFQGFHYKVQDEILASLLVLQREGPNLGRPYVDILKGSVHANMKELRVSVGGGVWRIAFAFNRRARRSFWRQETSVVPRNIDFIWI